jgi:pilus assembly protein Flp/PilA
MIEKLQFMTIMLVNDMKSKREERGATAVEYGLMVALIAIVIIAAVTLLGGNLSTLFDRIANSIN